MTAPAGAPSPVAPRATIRLDKWLWQARFLRTRALAATLVAEGRLRVNGEPTAKPARAVGEGDVLTFMLGGRVRVVRVLAPGQRRGPATEARLLYDDLAPEARPDRAPQAPSLEGSGPGGYHAPDREGPP